MYEAISATANFETVHKEIRCYQYLSSLANENNCFLKYYGTYIDGYAINLVMEWEESDLMNYLTYLKTINFKITEQLLIPIFYKLLISFAEMESHYIHHGDIKPHNIIVDKYWNLKIIDFSVAAIKNEDMTQTLHGENPLQGTPGYSAPEIALMMSEGRKTGIFEYSKADVFSLGMVFLQFLKLERFDDLNTVNKNPILMKIVETLEFNWARDLIGSMLMLDPIKRPRFKDCLAYLQPVYTRTISIQENKS